ncbi:MAG: helix-turn-helix domain-containing protein [Acidobacteriota bacterium]
MEPDLSLGKRTPAPARRSASPHPGRPRGRPRSEAKRARIIDAAMRLFAERGYQQTRMEDLAGQLSISKGSIFQHFKSKEGLFLEVYKKATGMLPMWLDAPDEIKTRGFFATLRYWLERTGHMIQEDWMPARIAILGIYGTDLRLKREINRYMTAEDPYGNTAFVRFGIERGEVRQDIAPELITSILEWTSERFQDALLAEELDPGLFRRHAGTPEKAQTRIDQFLLVLEGAIGRQ